MANDLLRRTILKSAQEEGIEVSTDGSSLPVLPIPNVPQAPEPQETLLPPVPEQGPQLPNIQDVIQAHKETFLPFPTNREELSRIANPVAGQFGIPKLLEQTGQVVEDAAIRSAEKGAEDLVTSPLGQKFPKTTAALGALGQTGIELTAGSLKPSSIQQDIGAAALTGGAGKAVRALGKKGIEKGAKVSLGIPEQATKQAFKNPAVTSGTETFATPDKSIRIVNRIKTAISNFKTRVEKEFNEALKAFDADKAAKTVAGDKVTDKVVKIKKELKIGEKGISKIEPDEAKIFKKLEKEITEEINKGKGNMSPRQLHETRKRIDREIDFEGRGDFFNAKLKELRRNVDKLIRNNFPSLKKADQQFREFVKTRDTVKRRTGIRPGKEPTDLEIERTERLAKRFVSLPSATQEALEKGAKKIGAGPAVETAKDISASKFFDPTQGLFFISPKNIAKRLLGFTIKRGKAAGEGVRRAAPGVGLFGSKLEQKRSGKNL